MNVIKNFRYDLTKWPEKNNKMRNMNFVTKYEIIVKEKISFFHENREY